MQTKSAILTFLLSALSITGMTQSNPLHYLITGTYTDGKSKGIYVFEFNSANGSYREVSHIQSSNPSFLAVSPDEKFVYATNENGNNDNGGEVSAFSFDKKTGRLTAINKQLSGGDAPCYIQADQTGKWVIAGNYSSGTLSVFPVNAFRQIE
ncbi:MAG TPA: beta-propeller fold lactonase family protein [Agriterribacter sp.]|nr:beta-propeller fold lactonase family protein [Agriterribacter sp.]